MDVDVRRRLRAGHRSVFGFAVAGDDGCYHRRWLPHSRLRHRLHVEGSRGAARLQPLLRLHEPVCVRHADAGVGRQPVGLVPRLGRRWPLQLSVDRLLPSRPGQRLCGPQGVRGHSGWRHGAGAWLVPAVSGTRHLGHSASAGQRRQLGCGHGNTHLLAAARWRGRQIRAIAVADLAAGCDGRPNAGIGADSRRHDGDRRRLSHRPNAGAVSGIGGRPARRRRGGPVDALDLFLHGAGANRHQAHSGLLDDEPDRLHVHGAWGGRLVCGDLPSDDPRLLQGAAVSFRRLGHSGAAP